MKKTLRIGTRGSQLALWQARWVQGVVLEQFPETAVELVIIKTQGDKILDMPLAKVGGKGLFVKEIEETLMDGRIDLAVHSMKDMPAQVPNGLAIGAVPQRESPLDALINNTQASLETLPTGARVGTSSLRRGAQIRHIRPDITIVPLRGNLDTRLKKLDSTELDAIVLAAAGLNRLGLADRITTILEDTQILPAVGQGALCIETRDQDSSTRSLVAKLDHADTRIAVTAERAFLKRLEGSCQVPLAALATLHGDGLHIKGLVAELDGSHILKAARSGSPDQAETIGRGLAEDLLAQGADDILERLKDNAE